MIFTYRLTFQPAAAPAPAATAHIHMEIITTTYLTSVKRFKGTFLTNLDPYVTFLKMLQLHDFAWMDTNNSNNFGIKYPQYIFFKETALFI